MDCASHYLSGDTPVVVGLKNSIVVDVTVTAIHPTDNFSSLISKLADSLLQMTFETRESEKYFKAI